jgi:hypothetical protein
MFRPRPGRWLPALLLVAAAPAGAAAQVVYPPLPEKLDVEFRYRIRADRDERIRQFRQLEALLKEIGFDRDTSGDLTPDLDPFDPAAERMRGELPAAGLARLRADPRVKTVLIRPAGAPALDPAARAAVRITLPAGLPPAGQQRLHTQVVARLGKLGFRELVGYDPRQFTLVRGDLPAGNLFRLLKDLRTEPSGWFAADDPADELEPPLRDVLPVQLVEVLAAPDPPPLPPAAVPPGKAALAPDLRAAVDDAATAGKAIRVEVVYDRPVTPSDISRLRGTLLTAYSKVGPDPVTGRADLLPAALEGVVGNVLTVRFIQPADAERFVTSEPGVVFARLPRPGVETAAPGAPGDPKAALAGAKLGALHAAGHTGKGVKVVVIGTGFPGIAADARTKLVDLTAELSPDLAPAPLADAADGPGSAAARAARAAAPDADLVLVRVDPASFFQVDSVARAVRGHVQFTDAMQSRLAELSVRAAELRRLNAEAAAEYRKAFADTSDEERPKARRAAALKALDDLRIEDAKAAGAIRRANALQKATEGLTGAAVVVNTLVWETGFALDGLSPLSRYLDAHYAGEAVAEPVVRSATRPRLTPRPVWVQAASPSAGSVWGGAFVDADGNGFAPWLPAAAPLPEGEWSRELNFLAARAADGSTSPTLKAGTKVRLTVQWRETHDPESPTGAASVTPLTLRVFRQLDPEGKTRASDELQEVARPVGGPYLLTAEPGYAVYEQVVEFAPAEDGRYAVGLEGRDARDPRLPARQRVVQVNPRVYAEFVGSAGRPVFATAAPEPAGVAAVGDAASAITVAATGGPQLTGAGPGVTLRRKPDLYTDGGAGGAYRGNGPAAGFAGGAVAALLGSGISPTSFLRTVGLPPGAPLVIPDRLIPRR